jgi:amino acid adenylation domain-containing protein
MAVTLAFEKAEIEGSVGARFARVADRFPERPAVVADGRAVSYAALAAAAGRVARELRARPETAAPVALLIEAGAPLFASMLGTLEAGRFYVPLDPELPEPRLRAIWDALGADVLIASGHRLDAARRLAGAGAAVRTAPEVEAAPPEPPSPQEAPVGPDDLAYVLFTSGSTGTPKGVMQSHRNVLHNVWKLASALSIAPEDRLSLLYSPSVGASVSDVFGALLNGAAVCPFSLTRDGLRRLPDFLTREGITILHAVPSVFRTLSTTLDGSEDLSRLRVVKLGGEPVTSGDFELYRRRCPRRCVFHVGYGATEINVIRQWTADHDTPWPGGLPLGGAVDETDVALVDEDGEETDGAGEIVVTSRTLALGYWKDPERTAALLPAAPGRPGMRRYRTGDLGQMLPGGLLVHLGRTDSRLKIRGHRVETAEVEAALLGIPGVREAAVGGRPTAGGTRLAAWVARAPGAPGIPELRRALAERLPAPQIPTVFVFLEALPRTPSGKIDRRALPDPPSDRPAVGAPFREPAAGDEAAVARAFAEALGLGRVGADDDFFELGGDSLSAVAALADASDALGVELSAADLLESPAPAGLAARARDVDRADPELVRLQEGDRGAVFVVPGGAGDREDLFTARRVARATGPGYAFLCFRSGPPPHPSAEALAARFLRRLREAAPRGPYAIVGDCVGGIVAFAMARRLRAEGDRVALLALLDAPYPSARRRGRAWALRHAPGMLRTVERGAYLGRRLAHHLGVLLNLPNGRIAYALRLGGVGARGWRPPEPPARRRFLAQRASYSGSVMAWSPAPFDGRVLLIESEETARRGDGEAWSRLAAGVEIVRVPGGHAGYIVDHGAAVGAALRRALEASG